MLSNSAINFSIQNDSAQNFQAQYNRYQSDPVSILDALQLLENETAKHRQPREKLTDFTKRRKGLIKDIKIALFFASNKTNNKLDMEEKNLLKIISNLRDIEQLEKIITNLAYLKNHDIIATRVDGSKLPSRTKIIFRELEVAARSKKHQIEYESSELSIKDTTAKLYNNIGQNGSEVNIHQALEALNTLASTYKINQSTAANFPSKRAALINDILNALTDDNRDYSVPSNTIEEQVKTYISTISFARTTATTSDEITYRTGNTPIKSSASDNTDADDVKQSVFDETSTVQQSQNPTIKKLNTLITDLSKLKAQPFAQRLDGKNGLSETIKCFERITHAAALKRLQLSLELSYPYVFYHCFTDSGLSYSTLRLQIESNYSLHLEHNLDDLINHLQDYLIVISDLSIIKSNNGFFSTPETRWVRGLIENISAENTAKQKFDNK